MIRFKIPLSKYSNHEIKEAYNRKISFGESKTKTQLEIHESFQVSQISSLDKNDVHIYMKSKFDHHNKVVSRVRNAKNRFRALSRGAVTGEKMGGILSKLKEAKNQEEGNNDKKKVLINVFQSKK